MKPRVLDAFKEVRKQMRLAQGKTAKTEKQSEDKNHETEETLSVKVLQGTGKIMVSGTTVHGIGTKFLTEVKQNDFFIIRHNSIEEKQKVILIISDKSALISESFEDERTSEYFIETFQQPLNESQSEPVKKRKIEDSSKVYEVRVKRGPWTYKVDKVNKSSEISNEDLLNIRTLRVRDKFCWM